jgi:hypothetical protein
LFRRKDPTSEFSSEFEFWMTARRGNFHHSKLAATPQSKRKSLVSDDYGHRSFFFLSLSFVAHGAQGFS